MTRDPPVGLQNVSHFSSDWSLKESHNEGSLPTAPEVKAMQLQEVIPPPMSDSSITSPVSGLMSRLTTC